jgi:hypothetical protein
MDTNKRDKPQDVTTKAPVIVPMIPVSAPDVAVNILNPMDSESIRKASELEVRNKGMNMGRFVGRGHQVHVARRNPWSSESSLYHERYAANGTLCPPDALLLTFLT